MIYKVDFEGQACKQIKEKAESYQYDLKSVLKGIGLLIADMWLPGDSNCDRRPQFCISNRIE